ncbi:hypothetical protein Tco_0976227 [Tanacetum coccineum]|uniref:Uncharacterized protein n=1 Tax=Tanacetum coccineum TaxID=301880 RepID=A0ABQ5EGL4_9ASTR
MVDQEEVHVSLLASKDAKRSEYYKLVALNNVIVEALEEIETQEVNVYILDGGNDGIPEIHQPYSKNVGREESIETSELPSWILMVDVEIYRFDETKEQKNETRSTNLALWDSRRLEVKQYSIMCGGMARMHVYNKQQFLIEDEAAAAAGRHLWFMMIIGFLVSSSNLVTTTKRKDLVIPVLCQTKVSAARVKRSFVLMLLASKVFNAAYSRYYYCLGFEEV